MRARTLMTYAIVLPLLAAAAPARAEIRVEGSASNVHVDARDAPVADVLATLGQRFGLRIRGAVGDGRISAHLDGSLRRVIARLLDGYNYVIRTDDDGLEVMVLNPASRYAVPPPIYAPPTYPAAKLRRDE